MQLKIYLLTLGLISLLFAQACLKLDELEVTGADPEFAFPLFQSTIKVDDLLLSALNDTLSGDTLIFDSQGNITLVYSGDVTEVRARQLFVFLDTVLNGLVPFIDTFAYAPFNAPPNMDIYKSSLSNGTMTIIGQNATLETITGNIQVPQLKKGGVSFKYDFVAPPGTAITSPPIPLKDYELTSTNDSLYFRYEAYLPDGTRIKLPNLPGGFPGLGAIINNLEFSYLEGYWGNERFPIDRDTIEIDINQTNFSGGDIQIKDPRVTVTVINSFGFPSRGHIKILQFKGRDGKFYQLESDTIKSGGIDFAYPPLNNVGGVRATSFYFDKHNSNIDVIFNAQPVAMDYEVEGVANVLQDPSLVGFLTDSSFIKFNVRVELPLEGSVRNFGNENEVDIDFGASSANAGNVESAEFKLVTDNGMPVGALGQVYFLDDQGMPIDSLFNGLKSILVAAPVNANGVATASAKHVELIPITGDRFDRIRNSKKARIRTVLETTDMGAKTVKVLSQQKTDIRMGVRVTFKQ